MLIALRRRATEEEEGFSLIEVLVAIALFAMLATVLFSVAINNANVAQTVRLTTDLNEQSRLVMNRLSRELREAKQITSVTNVTGESGYNAGTDTVITFEVDFDNDGTIEPSAPDPEELTYRYQVTSTALQLRASGVTYPILSDNVTVFNLGFYSQRYECDGADGTTPDGSVGWREIDAAAAITTDDCASSLAGPTVGKLEPIELQSINSVSIDLKVLTGSRQQDYRTRIDLRNRAT